MFWEEKLSGDLLLVASITRQFVIRETTGTRMLILVRNTVELNGITHFNSGACMRRLNVTHGDSRDEKKLKRFFPFEIKDHIIPSEYDIFSNKMYDNIKYAHF